MQGLSKREEDETESTRRERKTVDKGSLASGAVKAFRGIGGGEEADSDCMMLPAATDDFWLLVPLTSRAKIERALRARGTRTERAGFMAIVVASTGFGEGIVRKEQ